MNEVTNQTTNEMASKETSEALGGPTTEYIRLWATNFGQVLAQITGAAVPVVARTIAPADVPRNDLASSGLSSGDLLSAEGAPKVIPPAEDLWAITTSAGGLRGEMCLRVAPSTVLHLAQIFMSEPVSVDAPLTADHRDALIELLRQVAGLVSTSAKPHWGETQLRVEVATSAPSWPPAETFWLCAGEEGPARMVLEVGLSAALAAELRAEKIESGKTESAKVQSTPPASKSLVAHQGAMDLLMDVQLGVTMRFGSRRLLLREVLDLSPGAVIELDRRVQEPVDLLLDGRLVARGEVVVIEGNYGLRVTDASGLGGPATP